MRAGRDALAGRGAPWALVRLTPPTLQALGDALAAGRAGLPYQVLHFSGHGGPDGLTLEDDLGREQFVPVADLVALLRGSGVQVVVLKGCQTGAVAAALVQHAGIPCAIATRESIYDDEAALLAARLYGRLSRGESVQAALDEARRSLDAAYRQGELPAAFRDPVQRCAILHLEGDGALTLRLEGPGAERPLFILDATPRSEPFPFGYALGFVGRYTELLAVGRWLRQPGARAFAISGVGGVGKTALAVNVALRHAHRFDALAFASARGVADFGPLHVLQALNAALGRPLAAGEEANLEGAIARRLNDAAVLLVLDNLESLSPAQTAALARALGGLDPRCGSRVLMTLRPQEKDPLTTLAGRDALRLEHLDEASALCLAWEEVTRLHLLERVAPQPPHDEAALLALGRRARLEWLPLPLLAALDALDRAAFLHPALIRLGVAGLGDLSWDEVLQRLRRLRGRRVEEALEEMIGQMVDDLARSLPPDERRGLPAGVDLLYAALPFAGDAAEARLRFVALGEWPEEGSDRALDFKDRLLLPVVASNLLRRSGERYGLDAPVRAYLEQRHPPTAEAWRTLRLRHAEAHLALVADYDDLIGAGQMTYSAPLEWENVTAAFEFLAAAGGNDLPAMRLLVACSWHWRNVLYNNHHPRRMAWLEAARRATEIAGDRQERANVLQAIGDVQRFRDDYDAALDSYGQALTLYRAVGDRLGEANVLASLGRLCVADEPERAERLLAQAVTIYQQIGDRYSVPAQIGNFGWELLRRGERDCARPYLLRAAELFERMGLLDYAERHRKYAS